MWPTALSLASLLVLLTASPATLPDCLIQYGIGSELAPGSLARFGLSSAKLYSIVQKTLDEKYKKPSRDDERLRVYDIEKLYDLYHVLDRKENEYDRGAIQRLIMENYPEAKGNYILQHQYETLKHQLFIPDLMRDYRIISPAYPEVSRMLLKHKQFLSKSQFGFSTDCIAPELVDEFVGSLESIMEWHLKGFFKEEDPSKLVRFFSLLETKSKNVKLILETGNFDFLASGHVEIEEMDMLLVISMADEQNMETVIKVLSKFENKSYLLKFTECWMRYPHLKPIVKKIFAFVTLSEKQTLDHILALSDCTDCKVYYPLIREDADEALEYLNSFADGVFLGEKPKDLGRTIFEAALIYDMPEGVLRALFSQGGFTHDFALVNLALKKQLDSNLITDLLNSPMSKGYFTVKPVPVKYQVSLDLFKLLFSKFPKEVPISIPFMMIDSKIPHLEYLKYLLHDHEVKDAAVQELSSIALAGIGVDSAEMRTEIVKFRFERGEEFCWNSEVVPPEALEFLREQRNEALLAYIPKGEHSITKSSFGLAATIVVHRSGGANALFQHYGYENMNQINHYKSILLLAMHPNLTDDGIANFIFKYPTDAVLFLRPILEQQNCPEYADKVFRLVSSVKHPQIATFLGRYIAREVDRNTPVSQILPLKHITPAQLRFLIKIDRNSVDLLRLEYYGPHMARIFSDAGLIEAVLQQLVIGFGVTTYAEIVQTWSSLLPYLPEDPKDVQAMIMRRHQ